MKIILCILLLASGVSTVVLRQVSTRPSEVHRLYFEDQEDRGANGDSHQALPGDKIGPRDRARRERVHELLAANGLKTAEDFHDAAFIYQHGQTPADYLLAHVLAMVSDQKGDASSLWISAATLDRYLDTIGQAQVFGTQYHSSNGGPVVQEPYDRELIPDALRLTFCVPSVAQQQTNLLEFRSRQVSIGDLTAWLLALMNRSHSEQNTAVFRPFRDIEPQ